MIAIKSNRYRAYRKNRLLKSAAHSFETQFFKNILNTLSENTKTKLEKFLDDGINLDENTTIKLLGLKKYSAELKIDAILYEIKKYKTVQMLKLPLTTRKQSLW